MIRLTIIALACLGHSFVAAQDAKAKAILDKLSAQTKLYKTIQTEFQYTMRNDAEGINETQAGSLSLKGDKYVLSIQGQDIICDGATIWTHIKESEEVQVNNIPDQEEEDYISPNKIFTLYETGFTYKYVKEEAGLQVINLYPKNPEDKSFHRVELYINKAKTHISKLKVFGKDGTNMTYKINKFLTNVALADSKFSFSKADYPNIELIDLR